MISDSPGAPGPSLVYARGGQWLRWSTEVGEPEPVDFAPVEAEIAFAAPRALTSSERAGSFRLAAQFAFVLSGDAPARAFSRTLGRWLEVPRSALAVLLAFEQVRQVSDQLGSADEARAGEPSACESEKVIVWALDAGFLLSPPELPPVVSSVEAASPLRGPPAVAGGAAAAEATTDDAVDPRLVVYLVGSADSHYFPLALGMIRAYAEHSPESTLRERVRFVPFVMEGQRAAATAFMRHGPGVWLLSDYMWSLEDNLAISTLVKRLSRKNITVHGGPSAPKYPDASEAFLREHPQVDILVRGEGEAAAIELLRVLAEAHSEGVDAVATGRLDQVAGLVFASGREASARIVRTPERERIAQLDTLPSPYLHGIFDDISAGMMAATLETNRGCPYGCTFCDWGSATLQKIREFDLARVEQELAWIAKQQIPVVWLADANFGIMKRDVHVAEVIARLHGETGFPREVVVNYAKNATLRVADIVRTLTRAGLMTQGIISIQTRDDPTLLQVRRTNIKTKRYEELANVFREEGLPLSIELMMGLPGATVGSLEADLQHYFDEGTPVRVYETVVLPNSPMADPEYMKKHAIEIDDRGYVLATSSYTKADLIFMDELARLYRNAVDCAVLRYVLTYLQWDHGVPALAFLHALIVSLRAEPHKHLHTGFLLDGFRSHRAMRGGWRPLFEEVGRFAEERFKLPASPAFAAITRANELILPEEGRALPDSYPLEHDVVAYLAAGGSRRLESFGPAQLEVSDPDGIAARLSRAAQPFEFVLDFWELQSPLSRVRANVHFGAAPSPV